MNEMNETGLEQISGETKVATSSVEGGKKKRKFTDNVILLYLKTFLLMFPGQLFGGVIVAIILGIVAVISPERAQGDVFVTSALYASFIGIWLFMGLFLLIRKSDRPLIKTLTKSGTGNSIPKFLLGLLLGFVLNGSCILVAALKGDISLYFEAFRPISFVFIFVLVFIQSSAEELVCRGYLYQKLRKGYAKPWVAIVGNSMFFGVLHLTNEGITVISFINIVLSGIFMSLVVYYMDSLWAAMAVHTGWNFTQNILFGLPNSGNVTPYSVFKLDAATARDSFAYNVAFGVEGTIVADIVLLVGCALILAWGIKKNKQPTDIWAEN